MAMMDEGGFAPVYQPQFIPLIFQELLGLDRIDVLVVYAFCAPVEYEIKPPHGADILKGYKIVDCCSINPLIISTMSGDSEISINNHWGFCVNPGATIKDSSNVTVGRISTSADCQRGQLIRVYDQTDELLFLIFRECCSFDIGKLTFKIETVAEEDIGTIDFYFGGFSALTRKLSLTVRPDLNPTCKGLLLTAALYMEETRRRRKKN